MNWIRGGKYCEVRGISASTLKRWRLGYQEKPPIMVRGMHWKLFSDGKVWVEEDTMNELIDKYDDTA